MQIKFSVYDFYIFSTDKSILFLPICKYSVSKLTIDFLKNVESVGFIRIKGPRGARLPRIRQKIFPGGWDLTAYENLPTGMIMLGIN